MRTFGQEDLAKSNCTTHSHAASGSGKWCKQLLWKMAWQFPKRWNGVTTWHGSSTPKYLSRRNENRLSSKNLHMDVHYSIFHNSQKVEITQMSKNWWMDERNVAFPHAILLSNKMGWNTNTRMGLRKHHAQWKKPDTRRLQCIIPFMWKPRRGKSTDTKGRLVIARGWEKEKWEWRIMVSWVCNFILRCWKCFGIRQWLHNTVNIVKTKIC